MTVFRRKPLLAAPLLCGALLWAGAAPAAPPCEALPEQVAQLLTAMTRSAAQVDFSGVMTLQRGGDMQIVEISHAVQDGEESAAIVRLTGQDARVSQRAHPVECLHPGEQLRLSRRVASAGGICGLAAQYRFQVTPGERVAGRETLRLRVEPRDMYRYGHVLDLDRESALVLRASTLAADHRVLEQYQFASLQLHRAPPAPAAAVEHEAEHPHPEEPPKATFGHPWKPGWLPAGFAPTDAAPLVSLRKTYTDGMATFSVFVEPLERSLQPGEGVERQGSTGVYTRGTVLEGMPVLITVLGEVPVNTARMVADAVRLQRP